MSDRRAILVTGGAGFIGSNFVRRALARGRAVVVLDKLTYAGNESTLDDVRGDARLRFVRGDIADGELVRRLLVDHEVEALVNFAAETHVDRSIDAPAAFVQTNIVGTFSLLESVVAHLRQTPGARGGFRFVHVSTDEVYGSLSNDDPPFTERSAIAPSSPYSASKASADHLVSAYAKTFGLPAIITRCSNNYGPYQHPEKLVPQLVARALAGAPLLVYGDGLNVRDWIHVDDHCSALEAVLDRAQPGAVYNIGGSCERTNLAVLEAVCSALESVAPAKDNERLRAKGIVEYRALRTFVEDRPGHDRRYAIDASMIRDELQWRPACSFESALAQTVRWYVEHPSWFEAALGAGRLPERLGARDRAL
jgi:dTDP-glucose 4,6-dehydratase